MDYIILTTLILSLLVIVGSIVLVFKLFEDSKPRVEYIVLLAILAAMGALGRIPSAAIPGVQAASFIIIMVGIVFGKETGFLTGVLTALVSDLFMGLGYWTVFQMIAWGLMGLTAGILASKMENKYFRAGFGLMWGFFFGWITDLSMLFYLSSINLTAILGIFAAGFVYDLIHGITNAILPLVFYGLFKRIFLRSKGKLMDTEIEISS
jgi:energy-coupling factor transport system substrate-specific component